MHPEHPMRHGHPPEWAHGYGFDQFGPFVEVYVGEATLVLRWIPPGTFMMGSPEDEVGRDDDEMQHRVTLTQGFWMADAPVTQALWTAMMRDNPSSFKHPERPVEQVSWEDAKAFITRLNEMLPALGIGLPTEAQWEYACRAGTRTATYAGDLQVLGLNNAPVLDAIAWYGGNSGVDFDLSEGSSAGWSEKQYAFDVAGTRIVRQKQANTWGLYDTLGNVFEWCSDWLADYAEDSVNPTGPSEGDFRVIRGGSWFDYAEDLRAAVRSWCAPDDRFVWLGFRLSRGSEQSPRIGDHDGADAPRGRGRIAIAASHRGNG